MFWSRKEVRRAETGGKPVVKLNWIQYKAMNWILKKAIPYVKNYRTTLLGVAIVSGEISKVSYHLVEVIDGSEFNVASIQISWTAIAAGFGLIFSRDAKVSSQATGIRK